MLSQWHAETSYVNRSIGKFCFACNTTIVSDTKWCGFLGGECLIKIAMKRNSPTKKKSAPRRKRRFTLVETSSVDKSVVKTKSRTVDDKVIDGLLRMSDSALESHQFIRELNEQNDFGFCTLQMVELTYHGMTWPWPEIKTCSCTNQEAQGKQLNNYLLFCIVSNGKFEVYFVCSSSRR